jgi:hypothetical protein
VRRAPAAVFLASDGVAWITGRKAAGSALTTLRPVLCKGWIAIAPCCTMREPPSLVRLAPRVVVDAGEMDEGSGIRRALPGEEQHCSRARCFGNQLIEEVEAKA